MSNVRILPSQIPTNVEVDVWYGGSWARVISVEPVEVGAWRIATVRGAFIIHTGDDRAVRLAL